MSAEVSLRGEISRIRNVCDMLCSGHAALRDRYARMAFLLDLSILALSSWLSALAFVAPSINLSLTPFRLEPQLWVGVLSVATLFLAIVQLKTDWKGRADAHRRTLDSYAEVKREAGHLLATDELDRQGSRRVLARYDMASAVGVQIPERFFLVQKRRHKMKIALSKHLDTHPAASVFVTRFRFWIRDNLQERNPHA